MNLSELKECVFKSVALFYQNDDRLLVHDASEWAMAHRIAVYLEQQFIEKKISGWNIDCEYNRQGNDRDPKCDDYGVNKRPDIIIHRRRRVSLDNNLLIIEVKKLETDADSKKAMRFTQKPNGFRPFQYRYGLALSLQPEAKYHWFEDGIEIFP